MIRRPPRSTRTDTLFPYTTLFRSFTKTVFDAKTGELLGAHMIGAEVTELIQGYTIGKTAELVEDDFIGTVFPHPTLSETLHEGVLAAFRSEARRVGKEGVGTCRYRWPRSP